MSDTSTNGLETRGKKIQVEKEKEKLANEPSIEINEPENQHEDTSSSINCCKSKEEEISKSHQKLSKQGKIVGSDESHSMKDYLIRCTQVENKTNIFFKKLNSLLEESNVIRDYMDFLKGEKEEREKRWKLENELEDLASKIPSTIHNTENHYEDIKLYLDFCTKRDEKFSNLDYAYQELLKYEKNNFSELKAYCESWDEPSSVENYLKALVDEFSKLEEENTELKTDLKRTSDEIESIKKERDQYFEMNKNLEEKNYDLKEFENEWGKTVEYIKEVQNEGYRNKHDEFENQIALFNKEISNNAEVVKIFLDLVKKHTINQEENVRNNTDLLGITNFSCYLEHLSEILKDVNVNLSENCDKKKKYVQNKYIHVKSEYESLISEKNEINVGILQAIPEHFVDLCKDICARYQILLSNKQYDESEAMLDALEMCIRYTRELYVNGEYRNLLKSLN